MQQSETQISCEGQAINQRLSQLIANEIEQQAGVISFADFMQMALYTPQLGYYQNALYTLGELGDFITAPEMGDLFAFAIANSIASLPREQSQNLMEIGAGTGKLAADCLRHLANLGRQPENYFILEPSASLQAQQQDLLQAQCSELSTQVHWLTALPEQFEGVILANEVMDAIPFERVIKRQRSWYKLGVGIEQQDFVERQMEPVDEAILPKRLYDTHDNENYPENYTTEIRPLLAPWLKGLADCLRSGTIYLFDYGYPEHEYYHPQRVDGSLRCFSRHQANSQPLALCGLQDITAHVDFTQVARLGIENGLDIAGFTTQAGFLLENDILSAVRARELEKQRSGVVNYQLSQQIQKLTAPGQMGEVVKVIAFSKNSSSMPSGFKMQDQLHRL